MKALLAVLVLFAAPASSFAAELPLVKAPKKFFACRKDSDCAVAGDACRSCGTLVIINKNFLGFFDEMDQKARQEGGFSRACEACSTRDVILKCVKKRCVQGGGPI